jgi:putative flippase GtrA
MRLVTTYALFAGVATVVNIGVQDLAIRNCSAPFCLPFSVAAGTVAGLFCKYLLDKRYIFRFKPQNAVHDGRTFLLYSAMGGVTTLLFWGFEFGFDLLFKSRELRYLGGVIGLAIGYVSKYHLDRRFVFLQGADR